MRVMLMHAFSDYLILLYSYRCKHAVIDKTADDMVVVHLHALTCRIQQVLVICPTSKSKTVTVTLNAPVVSAEVTSFEGLFAPQM
jgi:hypothetical protein